MKEFLKTIIDSIHKIVVKRNTVLTKTFYYSEEEAKSLCENASKSDIAGRDFEQWWDNAKKK